MPNFSMNRRRNSRKAESKIKLGKQSLNTKLGFDFFAFKDMRFQFSAFLFIIFWAILWVRAFQLQIIDGQYLAELARKQQTTSVLVDGRRGTIYDRNNQVLARSVEVRSVYANPKQIDNPELAAKTLNPILNIPEEKLLAQLSTDKSFVWIARKVDDNTAEKIRVANISGVNLYKEYERVYPFKHLAGQLIGFVGLDGYGLEGIERSYNDTLSGMSAQNVATKDGRGRSYFSEEFMNPHGEDLHLSIDVNIQFLAEEALANSESVQNSKWAGVLVLDVKSGETLAWAQYPFFNPNNYRSSNATIYKNRLATDALEPGSTFKPFLIAAALEQGVVTPEKEYFCENGVWKTKYMTINDDGKSYQTLSVDKILRYSSNIGMAKIALDLGKENYYKYITQFGFGRRTNVGIGESKGIVRSPNEWSEVDLYSAGFGQSLSVTAVQMAQGYLILANDGNFIPVKITLDEENSSGANQKIISKEVANEVIRMMRDVVEEDGTGKRARINGVRVAGKTGTAQKAAQDGKGIKDTAYGEGRMASFVGILPADEPKYLIVVMLDEPKGGSQYGGAIAAPLFQTVAAQTMAYSGDFPDVVFAEKQDSESHSKKVAESEIVIKKNEAPNLVGKSVRTAVDALAEIGVIPELVGQGTEVTKQSPEPGAPSSENIKYTLWLS